MSQIKIIFFSYIVFAFCLSCTSPNEPSVDTQGMFEFPDDLITSEEELIPEYLDPEKILCNGKGLRVGRCISNQLKKGICLGIIKHKKRVFAIEIPCNDLTETEEVDSTSTNKTIFAR